MNDGKKVIIQSTNEDSIKQILDQLQQDNKTYLEAKVQEIEKLKHQLFESKQELTNVKVQLANQGNEEVNANMIVDQDNNP